MKPPSPVNKPAELPVINETTFKIERRAEPFLPGEKAAFTIQAPFAGVAWVSVETDEVLDTLLVPVKGNAGRIEVPIKEELRAERDRFDLSG